MTASRVIAGAALACGIVAGTVLDHRALAASASRADDILEVDLHVHAFPGDGSMPRWELQREAARRGLDAIVITNHNQVFAPRFGDFVETSHVIVIPGEEITTPAFHLVAAGIRAYVDWRLPLGDAIAAIHRQGGVAIAAHPVKESWYPRDEDSLRMLDGMEVAHPRMYFAPRSRHEFAGLFARARSVKPAIAPIGSSDGHATPGLGACRTYVFVTERTERGVLDAIRRGHTVAADGRGALTGDPERVRQVQARIADTPPPPVTQFPRLAATVVLLSLAALIILK
jgi:hypothetical protein